MADAAEEDFDFDVAIGGVATWDLKGGERLGGAGGGVGFGVGHGGSGWELGGGIIYTVEFWRTQRNPSE